MDENACECCAEELAYECDEEDDNEEILPTRVTRKSNRTSRKNYIILSSEDEDETQTRTLRNKYVESDSSFNHEYEEEEEEGDEYDEGKEPQLQNDEVFGKEYFRGIEVIELEDEEDDDDSIPAASGISKSKGQMLRVKSTSSRNEPKTISKSQFKKIREKIGTSTFKEFDDKAFNGSLSNVSLTWSKTLRTTAGITKLKRRKERIGNSQVNETRTAAIELSIKVIDNEERLRATLLHEMCHAAAWLVDGVSKPPHGASFKKWANIAMKNVKDVEVTVKHDYVIDYKFAWACTNSNCNVIIQRHSRSVDVRRHVCGKCKSKLFEVEAPKNNTHDGNKENLKPKKKREPSKFNLFVKQNSKQVRERLLKESSRSSSTLSSSNQKVSQAEVLKECSRLWKLKKEASVNVIDVDNIIAGVQNVSIQHN